MLDMPPPADAADPLAQPTRAALFRLLGELGRAATTGELAERVGLHPNGVRVHLERLERDGLLARTSEPRPRGRPRDLWTIAPGARPGGRAPRAYHDLASWLSRAIMPSPLGLEAIETTGLQIGRELAPPQPHADRNPLVTTLAALGFQPHADGAGDAEDAVTIRLDNCPYSDVAAANQQAICTLHRGITRGLLEILHPDARLVDFEPHDPDVAGCTIRVAGTGGTGDPR
jgi:predicted ArsR family transcriptional regulator